MAARAVAGWGCDRFRTGDRRRVGRIGGGGAAADVVVVPRRDGSRWKCGAVACGGRYVEQVEDDNVGVSTLPLPLLPSAPAPPIPLDTNEGEDSRSVMVHKDLGSLPRPLTVTGLAAAYSHDSNVRVAYQGLPGAFSEVAAMKAYPKCEAIPCAHFDEVFKAVELWLVDKAVLPVENSVGGSIHRNYDLILCHRLHIVGEVQLVIKHCLMAMPGVKKEELRRVLSHPQALDHCEISISKLDVSKESADDTAAAAQFVAANHLKDAGAVASARAAEIYGLNILAENFQDDTDNVTRFWIVAREPIVPRTDGPFKTSIVFTLEDGPGVIFKALAVFALRNINLSKIESRPGRKRPIRVDDSNIGNPKYFDCLFFIDFEASMAEPRTQNALTHLQEFATFLRVLGSYPMNSSL